ncbi:uncharacterized protein LOC122955033 [Acropora millepora]|uniref:uncharacterized protein LOC122955033 n=1 Tax=Acropora millepora TaxID=45264 RepID=UPI001CF4BA3E|nr:uncharacterized protein LOC122955033 [Acropora millepora]
MAASASTANSRSGEGVLICLSKASDDSDKSFLYMCKLEDNQIGEGNPVQLINPRGRMNLWRNLYLWRNELSFGEIVKFRIVENKYVYDGKTGRKKMNIDQIQMGLDFGFNSYRGLSDACPGVEFLPYRRNSNFKE